MVDVHKNFAYSLIVTPPSPAASGTSIVVTAGQGALFPTVPFNATIWGAGLQPYASTAEIVRVTNISTDTLTITRTQEGTSARSIITGDQIAATVTAKTLTDIEALTVGGARTVPAGVLLDGSSGCNVSSPDSAGLSITGDLDVAVRVASDDWSAPADRVFASKWTNSAGAKSWIFGMTSTGLFCYFSDDGTNAVTNASATLPLLNDGEAGWVRMTRDKATGTVSYYWAYDQVDPPNNWTGLGGGGVIFAATDLYDSTTAVKLGDVGSIAWRMSGTIYRAVIRAGLRGTIHADANFTAMGNPIATPAASTYTDSSGNVWTINGTAAIQSATLAVGDIIRWNGALWVPSAPR